MYRTARVVDLAVPQVVVYDGTWCTPPHNGQHRDVSSHGGDYPGTPSDAAVLHGRGHEKCVIMPREGYKGVRRVEGYQENCDIMSRVGCTGGVDGQRGISRTAISCPGRMYRGLDGPWRYFQPPDDADETNVCSLLRHDKALNDKDALHIIKALHNTYIYHKSTK